jgi:integrase/recombinase XerD
LEQAVQAFLNDLKFEHDRSANTLEAYRADLTQFVKVVTSQPGEKPTSTTLGPDQVAVYADWLLAQRYQTSTVARKMAAVRSFLKFSRPGEGIELESLLSRLKPPAVGKRTTRSLTKLEVASLIAAPRERGRARDLRDSAILELLYSTGIRAAEAVDLRVTDVDLFRGVLRGSGDRPEKPLGPASEPLRIYLLQGRPQLHSGSESGALFLNQRGKGLSRQGLWLVVKRWAKAIGLGERISPHTLRRSRAEHMLQDGRRKRDVQRFLGLTSPNTLRFKLAKDREREEEPRHE